MDTRKLIGSGGGGGSADPKETPDNLFSVDVMEAILGISEGPIKGLKNGPKSFYVGTTPLKSVDGSNNFDSFELKIRKGSELGETITSRMGGFASSTSVGVELATDTPVVRSGTHTGISFIDIRLNIARLLRTTDDGTFERTGKVKVEYKKSSSGTWKPVRTTGFDPPPPEVLGATTDVFTELSSGTRALASPGDRDTYWQNSAPPTSLEEGSLWFDDDDNDRPKVLIDNVWNNIGSATYNSGQAYWEWSERSSWGSDKQTKAYIRTSTQPKPSGKEQGDYLLHTDTHIAWFYNGAAWIVAGSSLTPGKFGSNETGGEVEVSEGEIKITGKTTTQFTKEFRIPVEKDDDDTYDIRITKTTPNNTSERFFDVSWESFQEVIGTRMTFPALATTQITARASDQFSSIPELWGVYQGRMIKVPSNYNETLRTYAGVWDGTWKIAYSNNPAYVALDLIENDRYGLNAYYPVVVNKYDVYEAGVWCDTLTANGRPRFTFNGLIAEPRSCREAIDYICGIFGGRFFDDGNGSATIKIDNDSTPTGLYTAENVEDGVFTYSFTELSGRFNDITVTFTNPALNYQEDRRRVFDQDHIDKYGRIPLNFVAVGCNSVSEALLRARYKLATSISENIVVSFKTNRQALYQVPYDIILIGDPNMNAGITGRVLTKPDSTTITLRDPVFLEAGPTYKIIYQIPDGAGEFTVEEHTISGAITGTVTTIETLTSMTAAVKAGTVFSIALADGSQAPRPFRILNISEIDGSPDHLQVEAIEVNRLKWAYIDGDEEEYDEPVRYEIETNGRPGIVPAARIRSYSNFYGGTLVYNIFLDWDPSPTKTVSKYRVYMSKDNSPKVLISESPSLFCEVNNVQPGEYLFSVVAVSSVSSIPESLPVVIEHRLIGDLPDPTAVANFKMILELSETNYARQSPVFSWDAITDAKHNQYIIRIYDPLDNVLNEYNTILTNFTYDYTNNALDHGGTASREVRIGVASQDQFGALSPFVALTVNNPQIPAIEPVVTGGVGVATVQWDTTGIPDYKGVKIWIDDTPGFAPGPTNLVYEGGGNSFTFNGWPSGTYYLRMATYDTFRDDDYNVSAEVEFTLSEFDAGTLIEDLETVTNYLQTDQPGGLYAILQDLEQRIEQNAANTADGVIANWENVQTSRREIAVQGARFLELINVASNDIESLASQVTILEADVDDNAAAILAEATTRATEDSALAGVQTTLATQVGSVTASGHVGMSVGVTPAGATARYQIVITTGTYSGYLEAGFYMDILPGDVTRVGIKAAQFVILDATGAVATNIPFSVIGGVARMNNAMIVNLNSTNIQAGGISADRISVSSLSAISATLGSVAVSTSLLVGTINGGTQITPSSITADRMNVTSLSAISATLGSVAVHGNLIVNGTINGLKIGGLEIDTDHMVSGSISTRAVDIASGNVNITSSSYGNTSWQTVASITISCRGGSTLIFAQSLLQARISHADAFGRCETRLLRDGSTVTSLYSFYDDLGDAATNVLVPMPILYLDNASQGSPASPVSHTYTIQSRNANTIDGLYLTAREGSGVMAINVKK